MIAITRYAGRKVALFGLGGSGLVSARALIAGGAEVVAYDDNPKAVAKAAADGVPTGDLREIDFGECAALVLAPGVPLTHPKPHWSVELARAAGLPIVGDIGLFADEIAAGGRDARVIAITGTNGKSTTTALIGHVLESAGRQAQVGGNLGPPALLFEPLEHLLPAGRRSQSWIVRRQRLGDDLHHPHLRVQRPLRILEDELQLPAHLDRPSAGRRGDGLSVQSQVARIGFGQAHQRSCEARFA